MLISSCSFDDSFNLKLKVFRSSPLSLQPLWFKSISNFIFSETKILQNQRQNLLSFYQSNPLQN